jgi:hypothetical protein
MSDIDRVQLLIGLSNNMRAENEEWRKQVFREGRERAMNVDKMIALFEQEYGALSAERDRLAQYLPKQVSQEPMPAAVTKGPRQ